MRSRDIIKYNQGKTVIVTMGEQKYVGTRMRDHYDYQQARLVFFSVFSMSIDCDLNNVFEIEKITLSWTRTWKTRNVSIFRFTSIKDVEKTEITSASFYACVK